MFYYKKVCEVKINKKTIRTIIITIMKVTINQLRMNKVAI